VISDKLKQDRSSLPEQLTAAGLAHVKLWIFDEVFELTDEQTESDRMLCCRPESLRNPLLR